MLNVGPSCGAIVTVTRIVGQTFLRMARWALLFCCLFAPTSVFAQLDAGVKTPYQFDVVLSFASHGAFTETYRDQTAASLQDLLQQHLGRLANVNVTQKHPLLKEIAAKGPQHVLDAHNVINGRKTQFVLLDYAGGKYRLRTRQHDGNSGLSSPVVQTASTSDRRQVVRLATQLLTRHFVLSATVTAVNGRTVDVAIQGGDLGVDLGPWLKVGSVFAVARIQQAGDGLRGERLPWGILRVRSMPKDGVCRCDYFFRYQDEALTQQAGVLGHRCLQWTTMTAPVALQLINAKTNRPIENMQVHIGSAGFAKHVQQLTTNQYGMARTPRPVANVAFVRVLSGTSTLANFPVAVVNDKVVTCRINLDTQTDTSAQLRFRHRRWLRRITEDLYLAGDRVDILNRKLTTSRKAALGYARQGLQSLQTTLHHLSREQLQLKAQARDGNIQLDLSQGQEKLQELRTRYLELQGFVLRLEKVLQDDSGAERQKLRILVEQAGLMEKQADYEKALQLYQKIVKLAPQETKIKAHLQKLQAEWALKNDAHRQARLFIYQTWPQKMATAALKVNLVQAKQAFLVCQKLQDRLTTRRMLQANLAHAVYLQKRLELLRSLRVNEDTQSELKEIAALGGHLRDLHRNVTAFVNGK